MHEIIGNTTATPNPRPDWNQVDETKADYIKNKPTLGAPNGVATLDEGGKVPKAQLPDDIGGVSSDDLKDYVKKTDYVQSGQAGIIADSSYFGLAPYGMIGFMGGVELSLQEYSERDARLLISKATLENIKYEFVKTGLTTNTETWTDEEKASACETIGAVQRKPNNDNGWNRVYGMNSTGNEVVYRVANGIQANTIAIRGVNGVVMCGTPSGDNDAVPKKYVEDNFVAKSTEALKIYGTDANGNQVVLNYRNTNNTKNTVAGRDNNGNIQVGTAVNPTDCVNLGQVESKFVAKFTNPENNANRRYVLYSYQNGTEDVIQYSSSAKEFAIAQFTSGGNLVVATPRSETHATTKAYVDNGFVAKISESEIDGSWYLYGADSVGARKLYKVLAGVGANYIPIRDGFGGLDVPDPKADSHATPKNYVDNLFVQANFVFLFESTYIKFSIYMKKSDYDTINSAETLATYLKAKGATNVQTAAILHMGEESNLTTGQVINILQYIYASNNQINALGYARQSGVSYIIDIAGAQLESKTSLII